MTASPRNALSRVRLAVVGGGFIGRRHMEVIDREPSADLVALADPARSARDFAARYRVACYVGVEDLLDACAVDGVLICTPTDRHLGPALAALEAGAHVLIEKPIAPTLDQATEILAKARSVDRNVLVGHHRRHYPLVERAREILESGEIGRLVTVNGQWTLRKDADYFAPDWRKRRAAGPVLTNLIHEIDLIRHVCGEIECVSAEVSSTVRGLEKEDSAALVMRLENGALGTFILSDGTPSPWAWELATGETADFPPSGCQTHRMTGSEGALEFPGLTVWKHRGPGGNWREPIGARTFPFEQVDAYARQLSHFCSVIRGDVAPLVSGEDATRSLAATLAVFDAAETGKRVNL